MLRYLPSMLAAAGLFLARRTLSREPAWDATLARQTEYPEGALLECARDLAAAVAAPGGSCQAVKRKYLRLRYLEAASLTVAALPGAAADASSSAAAAVVDEEGEVASSSS